MIKLLDDVEHRAYSPNYHPLGITLLKIKLTKTDSKLGCHT